MKPAICTIVALATTKIPPLAIRVLAFSIAIITWDVPLPLLWWSRYWYWVP